MEANDACDGRGYLGVRMEVCWGGLRTRGSTPVVVEEDKMDHMSAVPVGNVTAEAGLVTMGKVVVVHAHGKEPQIWMVEKGTAWMRHSNRLGRPMSSEMTCCVKQEARSILR